MFLNPINPSNFALTQVRSEVWDRRRNPKQTIQENEEVRGRSRTHILVYVKVEEVLWKGLNRSGVTNEETIME